MVSIKSYIYKRLPEVMRPYVKYLYFKHKYSDAYAQYSIIPIENEISYTSLDKYEREIKSSKIFEERFRTYCNLFNIENANQRCGGLQLDSAYRMYSIVRDEKPSTVVETGVANGVSSLAILLALEENEKGSLKSIDYPVYLDETTEELENTKSNQIGWRIPADNNPGWIIPDDLQNRWELIEGKSINKLPKIAEKNDIDIFIHDSQHSASNMIFEYFTAYHNMKNGGIILSDDISGNSAFDIFRSEMNVTEHGVISEDLDNDLGYIKI